MAMPVHDSLSEPIRPLRRVEYDQLVDLGAFEDEKIELLEGALVHMSPIGTPHCTAIEELYELLVVALAGRARVRIQMPFAALDTSEPEPDVALVPHGDRSQHPQVALWLIEVAETSLKRDRGIKRRIYARAGVPDYWIVNIPERCIEIFRDPDGDQYQTLLRVAHDEVASPLAFGDIVVPVQRIVP